MPQMEKEREAMLETEPEEMASPRAAWSQDALYLWERRSGILKAAALGLLLSGVIAFCLPKQYRSTIKIMPPEQPTGGGAMLAALSRATGAESTGLAALGSGLLNGLGARNDGELFMDLMRSGTVTGDIATRFHLQQVFHKRYMTDTLKKLVARTEIEQNKKSGLITITVTDTDRGRAQEMAQAYVDELNKLLVRVSTSSARRERMFVETRLQAVQRNLSAAEQELSEFSSKNSAVDIKEQTRAMVDAGARLQAQLIVGQSDLESLRQMYGDQNVRVRAAEERVAVVQHELNKMGGVSGDSADAGDQMYPPLRQMPALGVQWADLYRNVRVQETVYELLSAENETARIQEAKEVGVVSVVDAASWPEKKSFPPRLLLTLAGGAAAFLLGVGWLLACKRWGQLDENDDVKLVASRVMGTLLPRRPKGEASR